jgi:hypothetical protein
LFTNFVLATAIEFVTFVALQQTTDLKVGQLCTGPWVMIFALFVNYFRDIPKTSPTLLFGFAISSKVLYYSIALHVATTSPEYCVTALAGLASGIICRSNLGSICDWLCLPESLSNRTAALFGSWFESKAPKEKFNGATIEIQRQQQMDELENNLILESQNDFGGITNISEQDIEQHVNELVEMGFDRQAATQALQRSGNDIAQAAALLVESV